MIYRWSPHLAIRPAELAWLWISRRKYTTETLPTCVPVVIVGAGPTGLVLSSLLSQYGVQHMLLEKNAGLTQHPQAHYINNRTMEVFRCIPGLSQQVTELSPSLSEWRRFIYCESMVSGQLLGEVDHFPGRSSPCDAAVSPEPVAHLSQHRLVALLLKRAQQLTGVVDAASICFNTQVDSVSLVTFPHEHQQQGPASQHSSHQQQQPAQPHHNNSSSPPKPPIPPADKQANKQAAAGMYDTAHTYPVCVAVTRHHNQQQQPQKQLVRCSYLVAADGSNSTIRRLLDIPMHGKPAMQHLISIHFSWPQLGRVLLQRGREGMLYFVFTAQVVAVLVAHDLSSGEFVAQVPYFPPLQSPDQFTTERCQQLIEAAAGFTTQQQQQQAAVPAGAEAASAAGGLQVHTIRNWVMSAEVAEEYAAWGNRLLLAGDAAHRFPPAGGFGMNTGIQDAHNLAWKLAAVLTGRADPALLSTYQPERSPVARANAALSVNNWHEAIRIPQALGLDPAAASLVNNIVSTAPLPAPVASWLLDAALAAGRGLAKAAVSLRRAALQDILASGMSLRLQFPKEDLGFVYEQGAVVDAGSAAAAAAQEGAMQLGGGPRQQQQQGAVASSDGGTTTGHRSSVYEPAIVVGGRLPHCWLQLPAPDGQLRKVSTLDMCTPHSLGLGLLLLCSPRTFTNGSSSHQQCWASAGLQLAAQGWPVRVVQILRQGADVQAAVNAASSQSNVAAAGEVAAQPVYAADCEGVWAQLQESVGPAGAAAVLVRPDGHIAWVAPSEGVTGQDMQQQVLLWVMKDVLHYVPRKD